MMHNTLLKSIDPMRVIAFTYENEKEKGKI